VSSELRFEGGGRSATLTIKESPRAKVMRLRVDHRTGTVLLTLPRRASRRRALEWVAGQRGWIEETLAKMPVRQPLGPGAVLPFRGEEVAVDWAPGRPRTVKREEGRIVAGGPEENLEARLLRWLRREALDLLAAETAEFAEKAGVKVDRVSVGDPVSRWGSCSSAGAIRYSWRLILAPDFVRRATVAHEVAHRVHMNHSPRFHALVEALLGADPRPARLWLRRSGLLLHRIGAA
jgi:hypothetical protein